MQKTLKRLQINRETLRQLGERQLEAAGGAISTGLHCVETNYISCPGPFTCTRPI